MAQAGEMSDGLARSHDGDLSAAHPRLAYLMSRYPAVSHTFFLEEIQGLRALGLHIETASINAPDRAAATLPAEEQAEAENTYYLKVLTKSDAARELLRILMRHPAAVARGVRAVLAAEGLTLKRRAYWFAYLAEALLLGAWMQQRRLSHLHVHFGGPVATVGLLAAEAWRIPWSLTVHGPEELLDRRAWHLREKLESAAFVICISDFCKSQLMHMLPAAQWEKLCVVRLGVGRRFTNAETAASDADGSSKRPVRVVCVGRLVPEKGQRILLAALAELRKAGLTVHATFVGDGPDRADLQAYARELGVDSSVLFTGAQTHAQTHAILRTADVFALPSFAEGLPVALMEAMALGIPCVSTSIAAIPELIADGVNGCVVSASSVGQLAAAIDRLARSPELRQTMGAAAQTTVAESYTLPANLTKLAEIFEQHAGKAAHRRRDG